MEERQVTIEGETLALEMPFFVLATQNPIEQEGTYPLPEAQLDRFVVKLSMGYPSTVEQETMILKRRVNWRKDDPSVDVAPVITQPEFLALQAMAENAIYIDDSILEYVSKIVRATREHKRIEIGSSPRGALSLLKLSRCLAVIYGRDFVIPDDIKLIAPDVLSHRIILKVEEMIEGTEARGIISEILNNIPAPLEFKRKV
jgi:MoxR-like ATPase